MQRNRTRPAHLVNLAVMGIFLFQGVGCESSGAPEGPSLTASPATLSFGTDVPIGTTRTLDLLLTNDGTGDLQLTGFSWEGSSNVFRVPDADKVTLAEGNSITFHVTFQPTNEQSVSASFIIATNSSLTPSITIALSGKGVSPDSDSDGFTVLQGDCDDSNADVYPDAIEVCNEVDDNCDGVVDNDAADGVVYYTDDDGDGYGNIEDRRPVAYCEDPGSGYADNNLDCDDSSSITSPEATEVCDAASVDENCNGEINENTDNNGDSVPDCLDADFDTFTGDEGDCNDLDATVFPGTEELPENNLDDDCDGLIDENSPPQVTITYPVSDGDFVSPGLVDITALVVDDYDPTSALRVDVETDNKIDTEPPVVLCQNVIPDDLGNAVCNANLRYGENVITVKAKDSQGEERSRSRTVRVDFFPEVSFEEPNDGNTLDYGVSTPFIINYSDQDGEVLTKANVQWTSSLEGVLVPDAVPIQVDSDQIGVTIALTVVGEQVITATLTDSLGASTSATVTVTVMAPECGRDNVVALWNVDEGAGNLITDEVGGLIGTLSAVDWVTSPFPGFGSGIHFVGESFSEVIIDDPYLDLTLDEFTLDFWYAAEGPRDGDPVLKQALLYKRGDGDFANNFNYFISVNEFGYISAAITTEVGLTLTAQGTDSPDTKVLAGESYYVAATFDGRFLRVYLNGLEQGVVDAGTAGASPLIGLHPIRIGTQPDSASPRPYSLSGIIDDLQFMDCGMVTSEIQQYYTEQSPHSLEDPEPTPEPTPTP